MHGLTIDIWDVTISYIYGLTQPERQIKKKTQLELEI